MPLCLSKLFEFSLWAPSVVEIVPVVLGLVSGKVVKNYTLVKLNVATC